VCATYWEGIRRAMQSFVLLVDTVLQLYLYCIVAMVIVSWLVTFNVINTHNRFVFLFTGFLFRITEPALKHIRRFMPQLGGIDISPVALMLAVVFARSLLHEYLLF
jgi:YggT family protein